LKDLKIHYRGGRLERNRLAKRGKERISISKNYSRKKRKRVLFLWRALGKEPSKEEVPLRKQGGDL